MKSNDFGLKRFLGFSFHAADISFATELKELIICQIASQFNRVRIAQSFEGKREKVIAKKNYLEIIKKGISSGWSSFVCESESIWKKVG
jgi:hypothetical protein